MKRIYLDYAAATPVLPEVKQAMEPYWDSIYGNPNALYAEGQEARKGIEEARKYISGAIGATEHELVFTSGGTEANSMAIRGALEAIIERGTAIKELQLVTSAIEHPSVKDVFAYYEKRGAQVCYLPVEENGIVSLSEAEKLMDQHVTFVSLMFANNEIGTLQPVGEIARIARKKNAQVVVHCDASQAPLFFEISVQKLGVDLLTLDAQKLYGPKGVGALFVKKGTALSPLFIGGKQERGLRPGTPNVPGIVGFHAAYKIADRDREALTKTVTDIRYYFSKKIKVAIPDAVLNGDAEKRLPNNLNISFPNSDSEFLVLQLDRRGVACSAKSACLGSGVEGSYVVGAIDPARARGAIRFSLGRETTKEDVDSVVSIVEELILRH